MFARFNLEVESDNSFYQNICNENMYEAGKNILAPSGRCARNALREYIVNYEINAASLTKDWFPDVSTDVFISHSHMDEKFAICLAGWLCQNFGITSFVDSQVWGYSDDLLKEIDNEYCKRIDGYYSYEMRNKSTSHVHMMLSTALTKMIDKCECIIFLNTPNSVKISDIEEQTSTYSPWIYSEILMTALIKTEQPPRHRQSLAKTAFDANINESLAIKYLLPVDKLTELNLHDFKTWRYNLTTASQAKNQNHQCLDALYKHKGLL